MDSLALIAGTISSIIFASSHIPMLLKAYRTKDLHSYSAFNLILVNAGNLLYSFYVITLPLGPIWILHAFYTLSSGLLLVMYWRQAGKPAISMSHWLKTLMQILSSWESSTVQFLAGLAGIAGTDRPVAAQCGPIALVKLNQLSPTHSRRIDLHMAQAGQQAPHNKLAASPAVEARASHAWPISCAPS